MPSTDQHFWGLQISGNRCERKRHWHLKWCSKRRLVIYQCLVKGPLCLITPPMLSRTLVIFIREQPLLTDPEKTDGSEFFSGEPHNVHQMETTLPIQFLRHFCLQILSSQHVSTPIRNKGIKGLRKGQVCPRN